MYFTKILLLRVKGIAHKNIEKSHRCLGGTVWVSVKRLTVPYILKSFHRPLALKKKIMHANELLIYFIPCYNFYHARTIDKSEHALLTYAPRLCIA